MRRLLFVGGDLNGQLLPMHDDDLFESPASGLEYRRRPGNRQYSFPMMICESARDDWQTVRDAVEAFFKEESQRKEPVA